MGAPGAPGKKHAVGGNMNISDIVVLLGGVAMFLFGMSLMGDSLKKVAGNKLELILYRLSGTPFRGILLGAGVTAVIQSSSATSVMVVGFVNSMMMKLRQALAVIMGAVVGTSITGWLIALGGVGGSGKSPVLQIMSTQGLSAIAAIVGILMRMICKKKSMYHTANILMGFAVLMFGMKTMSGAVSGLEKDPNFTSFLTSFSNPFLGILIGAVFTAILQSASASVGILQAMSSTGVLTFEETIPIVLGIAIGASVPVILSGLGSSTEGKRAAFAYPVIEILRVLLFSAVFYGLNAALHFSFMDNTVNMVSIALMNTLFRVGTVLVLAWFIPLIEKLMKCLVKAAPGEEAETEDMNRLEERFLAYPTLAVEQTRLTMNKMAELTSRSLSSAMALLDEWSQKGLQEVTSLEDIVDRYEDRIGSYLMRLTGQYLTETQNKAVSQYLRAITDFERISDHALNIAQRAEEINEKKIRFSDKGEKEMIKLRQAISEITGLAMDSFMNGDTETAYRVEPLEQVIDAMCRKMREKHTARLQKGKCTIGNGYVFNDLISEFERVSDHCSNIAIVQVELEDNALDVHEMSDNLKQEHTHQFDRYFEEYADRYLKKKDEKEEKES